MTAKNQYTAEEQEEVQEAQGQILEALETLKRIARQHDAQGVIHMTLSHIECSATKNHGWLDSSETLDDWLEEIAANLTDEDEDEDGDEDLDEEDDDEDEDEG